MFKKARYHLKIEKKSGFAFLSLLPLLLALGFWQLQRAEEKRILLNRQTQGNMAESLHLTASTDDNVEFLRYKKVEVSGHYDTQHQFLLDNQVSAGKAGYFVLTPFVIEGNNKAVLINRGWILNPDRSKIPDVTIVKPKNLVKGRINNFPGVGIKLSGADIPAEGWPSIVQVVNSEILEKWLGYPLFHFQIELDKQLDNGFSREWQTITIMPPEQHTAYAVQWFGLALTLTILFLGYSLKKNND